MMFRPQMLNKTITIGRMVTGKFVPIVLKSSNLLGRCPYAVQGPIYRVLWVRRSYAHSTPLRPANQVNW